MNKASFVHGLGQGREDKSNGGIDCVAVAVEARPGQMDDALDLSMTNRGAPGDEEWNATTDALKCAASTAWPADETTTRGGRIDHESRCEETTNGMPRLRLWMGCASDEKTNGDGDD